MTKIWKEISPWSGLALEDAPANAVASGDVDMNVTGGKKKKTPGLMDGRTKSYRSHRERLETRRAARMERKSKFIEKVKENTDMGRGGGSMGPGFGTMKPVAALNSAKMTKIKGPLGKHLQDKGRRSRKDSLKPSIGVAKSGTGYELYHKDFSGAMQHAYKFAKSKGVTVDPDEIDSKVATGPKKPSSGKTNKYILGTNKKNTQVHIQVANLDNKRYELNMYID